MEGQRESSIGAGEAIAMEGQRENLMEVEEKGAMQGQRESLIEAEEKGAMEGQRESLIEAEEAARAEGPENREEASAPSAGEDSDGDVGVADGSRGAAKAREESAAPERHCERHRRRRSLVWYRLGRSWRVRSSPAHAKQ
mmetsp:Transcript_21068/g.68181  ORF Transcript_21068/g.68181 Transcript_21068/m.68181 type:complete len:140 (-) Transcript_21068:74-493(-)